ncbi:DUF4231 domain-containing protein [Microbacterium sp. P01]|uniref:DUF4231 domain-containing protein n=1 Tax=Microbacterium sp. P01 TaxID=3366261 RepID=UPI00366BD9E7
MSALEHVEKRLSWYIKHQLLARTGYVCTELLVVLAGVAIPVVALYFPKDPIPGAWLGAIVAALTALRIVLHFHANWRRFAAARLAIGNQIELYKHDVKPYDNSTTRDGLLLLRVQAIESRETAEWVELPPAK